jgi:hypothetical protein
MKLIERLPNLFHPTDGEPVPHQLIGAKIKRIGTLPFGTRIEGGGLVIEYFPAPASELRRMVFAFTELGLWVHSDELAAFASQDESPRLSHEQRSEESANKTCQKLSTPRKNNE